MIGPQIPSQNGNGNQAKQQPDLRIQNMNKYDDVPVEVSGRDYPPPIENWRDAALGSTLIANIEEANYLRPTPIQKHSLAIVLKGRDLMGCAQTGSGKTAAFLLPIIAKINSGKDLGLTANVGGRRVSAPAGLVIAPTRELASQIYDESWNH